MKIFIRWKYCFKGECNWICYIKDWTYYIKKPKWKKILDKKY